MNILYLDEQLLVVDKPPGMLAQPDRTGAVDVVTRGRNHLAEDQTEEPFLGLVHRLDRPASGIMVLARTSDAARHLSTQFRERLVDKRYLLLVEGEMRGIGSWTDHIAKPNRQPQLVAPDHPAGAWAELDWQALVTEEGITLLQVELKTGRPHQIRLQASSRGHPVVGDARYGAQSSLGTRAIALHHTLLRIELPAQSRQETFVTAPPAVWQEATTDAMDAAIERMLNDAQIPDQDGP